jgi:phosphoribosylformylglycinamidine (FGAM) synthase-like enzyme
MIVISSECAAEAKSLGLSRSELERLVNAIERQPTREELAVCGALWSEHCSYKSSRVHLKRFHTKEPWVLQGPGENAGVYAVNKNWGIAFKMESHNHPSYIEPYQGAATGVGGILRDVFCMGARPIASLNCLRFGQGEWNAHLVKRVVEGIADYGNSVGVPTVGGDTQFHQLYSKNILVNAFTAGLIHKDKIFKGVLTEAEGGSQTRAKASPLVGSALDSRLRSQLFPESENILVYFGSATGRDGVHGATMSSAEFSAGAETLKPTVQVGDPFAEKVLLEATMALINSGAMVGLQDMGAAGLTSSSAEMAGRSGCGVAIDLSAVPLRVRGGGLQAWEILLSESQERMLCAVTPANLDSVLKILSGFEIPYSVIGRVNNTGRFVCVHQDVVCTDLPVDLLTDGAPVYEHPLADRGDYLKKYGRVQMDRSLRLGIDSSEGSDALRVDVTFSGAVSEHARHVHDQVVASASQSPVTLKDLFDKPALRMGEVIAATFALPSFSGRSSLVEHYCATVGGETVLADGASRTGAAAVVRLPPETVDHGAQDAQAARFDYEASQPGVAFAGGCQERWVMLDPLEGSSHSTAAVARKIVAVGAKPRAMTDCLNFGSPQDPYVMRQISDSIDGINRVARGLGIPVVSGNVSLNNQTDGTPIPPTPMIAIAGDHADVRRVVPSFVGANPKERSLLAEGEIQMFALMPKASAAHVSYAISETALLWGGENFGPVPQFDVELERSLWDAVNQIQKKFPNTYLDEVSQADKGKKAALALCRPIGRGGVYFAALRAALESHAHFYPSQRLLELSPAIAFGEGQAGFVFAVTNAGFQSAAELVSALESSISDNHSVAVLALGKLVLASGTESVQLGGISMDCRRFQRSLAPFFSLAKDKKLD